MGQFKRLGNRPSSLPIAQFCAMSPKIGSRHGAGRSAAMSSAYHAKQAGVPEWRDKWALLTDDEREEVSKWHAPSDVEVGELVLRYEDAEKECPVGTDIDGWYMDPDEGDVMTAGTLDFAWIVTVGGRRIAYVADLKRCSYTVKDTPEDSLQLHFYGWAYAAKNGCDAYVVGFFFAEEGEWSWSPEAIDPLSERGQEIWARVRAAAMNTGDEYNVGPHCRGCYSRLHCQEYALPANVAEKLLGPLADGEVPPDGDVSNLVIQAQAVKDLAEAALKQLQAWIESGAVRAERDGKKYVPDVRNGRTTISIEAARKALGEVVEPFISKGKPYTMWVWKKA